MILEISEKFSKSIFSLFILCLIMGHTDFWKTYPSLIIGLDEFSFAWVVPKNLSVSIEHCNAKLTGNSSHRHMIFSRDGLVQIVSIRDFEDFQFKTLFWNQNFAFVYEENV